MSVLGVQAMNVEPLDSNSGANAGVWVLSDPSRRWGDLVVKLRLDSANNPLQPTEMQQLRRLAREHPELSKDPLLAFPSKVISCSDASSRRLGDLIVAPRAPGQMLVFFIVEQYYRGDAGAQALKAVFEKVGRQLRIFHYRYGKMHCDFHAANIIVDSTGRVMFVDLAMMGSPGEHDDVAHFRKAIDLLKVNMPPASWLEAAFQHFERGYRAQSRPGGFATPAPESSAPTRVATDFAAPPSDGVVSQLLESFEDFLTYELLAFFVAVSFAAIYHRRASKANAMSPGGDSRSAAQRFLAPMALLVLGVSLWGRAPLAQVVLRFDNAVTWSTIIGFIACAFSGTYLFKKIEYLPTLDEGAYWRTCLAFVTLCFTGPFLLKKLFQ